MLWPIAALIGAMVSIEFGAALSKSLFAQIGPEGVTTLRLGFSAIILGLIARPWRTAVERKNLLPLLFYGISMGGVTLFFYMALKTIPLGVDTTIEFAGPLTVAAMASRRWLDFLWIGIAVLGILMLMPVGLTASTFDPKGVSLALCAGVCWAGYIIFGRKAGSANGMQTTAIGLLIATLVVLPFGIGRAGMALLLPENLPVALAVAILAGAIPFSLEMWAMQRLPTRTVGTFTSLEPAIASLVGLVALHENLAPVHWVAIALIVAASAGTAMSARSDQLMAKPE